LLAALPRLFASSDAERDERDEGDKDGKFHANTVRV
jgi:hypothetical protein